MWQNSNRFLFYTIKYIYVVVYIKFKLILNRPNDLIRLFGWGFYTNFISVCSSQYVFFQTWYVLICLNKSCFGTYWSSKSCFGTYWSSILQIFSNLQLVVSVAKAYVLIYLQLLTYFVYYYMVKIFSNIFEKAIPHPWLYGNILWLWVVLFKKNICYIVYLNNIYFFVIKTALFFLNISIWSQQAVW